jgi:hypothetical protein
MNSEKNTRDILTMIFHRLNATIQEASGNNMLSLLKFCGNNKKAH